MNNNRGQSLVTFVLLLLPISFLILLMVYEVGRMYLIKNELNSINYLAMDYGLDNLSDSDIQDKLKVFILKNKEDIDNIIINVEDEKIRIVLSDRYTGVTNIFKNSEILMIRSNYIGYIDNNKKIIKDSAGDEDYE